MRKDGRRKGFFLPRFWWELHHAHVGEGQGEEGGTYSISCSGRRWRKEGGERSKDQYTSDKGEKFPRKCRADKGEAHVTERGPGFFKYEYLRLTRWWSSLTFTHVFVF
jgi:hypothetical protein